MKQIIILILGLLIITAPVIAQKSKKNVKTKKIEPTKINAAKTEKENTPQTITSKTESEILDELNSLRAHPQNYIPYLEEMKKSFQGKNFKNSQGVEIITFEGVSAVDEAIKFLKTQTAIAGLKISNGLNKAANQHLQDMIKNEFFGHRGRDQSLPNDRAALFGTTKTGVNENLTEGSKTPREIVLQMIVNDGLKSRSQRNNLFNSQLKVVGIAAGEGKNGFLCVLLLADSFQEKN
jgi:uncharacterized protein YkwD